MISTCSKEKKICSLLLIKNFTEKMGGDGGSCVSRIDMVRTKGYASAQRSSQGAMGYQPNGMRRVAGEEIDLKELRRDKMSTCALTGEKLEKPIVACRVGKLYNKESVVRALLAKKELEYISSLKDVIELKMDTFCPVTLRDLKDGVTRSQVIWPCGCVLSVTVGEAETCASCGKKVELKTQLIPEENSSILESQTKIAKNMRNRQKRKQNQSAEQPSVQNSSSSDAIKKYKSSSTYSKLFHDPSTISRTTDAFGRSFSSKGVGL